MVSRLDGKKGVPDMGIKYPYRGPVADTPEYELFWAPRHENDIPLSDRESAARMANLRAAFADAEDQKEAERAAKAAAEKKLRDELGAQYAEIRQWTGETIWRGTAGSFRSAIGGNIGLDYADLRGASLAGAEVGRTFNCAKFDGADLSGARLCGSYNGASFAKANLRGANLWYCDLRGANLTDVDLTDAEFLDCDLANAQVVRAKLTGANLSGAHHLTRRALMEADLDAIRRDFFSMLDLSPDAIPELLKGLREDCGYLRLRYSLGELLSMKTDVSRPAERWSLPLFKWSSTKDVIMRPAAAFMLQWTEEKLLADVATLRAEVAALRERPMPPQKEAAAAKRHRKGAQ